MAGVDPPYVEDHHVVDADGADQAVENLPCPLCAQPRELVSRDEFGPVVIFRWKCTPCGVEGTSQVELARRYVS